MCWPNHVRIFVYCCCCCWVLFFFLVLGFWVFLLILLLLGFDVTWLSCCYPISRGGADPIPIVNIDRQGRGGLVLRLNRRLKVAGWMEIPAPSTSIDSKVMATINHFILCWMFQGRQRGVRKWWPNISSNAGCAARASRRPASSASTCRASTTRARQRPLRPWPPSSRRWVRQRRWRRRRRRQRQQRRSQRRAEAAAAAAPSAPQPPQPPAPTTITTTTTTLLHRHRRHRRWRPPNTPASSAAPPSASARNWTGTNWRILRPLKSYVLS